MKELQEKMKELKPKFDLSTFGCIVKTRTDSDDGVDLFNFALSEEQWQEYSGPQSGENPAGQDCANG